MAKGMMIVDGQRVNFDGEKNVLSVIRKAGIEMPTFCYYSDLSVYGACRMCVVEDEKTGKIDASCSMEPRDGMRISTNSARLLKHRRVILELLLASHNCNCTTCEKSGHCRLQELAQQFGVRRIRFPDTREHYEIDSSSPAVLRDPNKCILCGDCVRVCEEMQGMGILNFAYRGSNLQVMPAFDRKLAETKCVSCGQCAAVCTTGAITVKNQIGEAWRAIHDPSKRVVIQIAPAVRVAVGEAFGFPAGENVLDRLVTALKLMGVDEVYDTTFGADFTTIAESEEFLERLKNGGTILTKDYFEEQLERIRDIRSSERRFYQKITDIYSQCSADYDVDSPVTKEFFATVQNKLHYAITKHTAAEIIYDRADSTKPNMGLTTWKNAPQGRIRKSDVAIAKNYLDETEMGSLNEIVTMYLDYAERQARRGNIMYMQDWVARLDAFLQFNEEEVLHHKGKVTAAIAKAFAESEFEKYRVIQDRQYQSDFDRLVASTEEKD